MHKMVLAVAASLALGTAAMAIGTIAFARLGGGHFGGGAGHFSGGPPILAANASAEALGTVLAA